MRAIFEKLGLIKKRTPCARKDCASGQPPYKIAVVAVWASLRKDHEPACFVFQELKHCLPCSKNMTVENLVDHNGQVQLNQAFGKAGKALPRWETAELRWRDA